MGALSTTESFELGGSLYVSDFITGIDGWARQLGTTPTFTANQTSPSGVDGMLKIQYPSGSVQGTNYRVNTQNTSTLPTGSAKDFGLTISLEIEGDADAVLAFGVFTNSSPGFLSFVSAFDGSWNLEGASSDTLYTYSTTVTGGVINPTNQGLYLQFYPAALKDLADATIYVKDIGWYYYD